ncbi:hypothetical protein [Chishuiella changwenlii]|uniref:hypothetical protein n=1 Tax=Chishuiella changwenlii TaxID=1434701 RepID=UPI002FDAF464
MNITGNYKLNKPQEVSLVRTLTFVDEFKNGDIIEINFTYLKNKSILRVDPISDGKDGFDVDRFDINTNKYITPKNSAEEIYNIIIDCNEFNYIKFEISGFSDLPIVLEKIK